MASTGDGSQKWRWSGNALIHDADDEDDDEDDDVNDDDDDIGFGD